MFHHMILDRPKKPGVIAQLCCAEGEVFPEAGHSAVVYRLAQRLDKQLRCWPTPPPTMTLSGLKNMDQANQSGGNVVCPVLYDILHGSISCCNFPENIFSVNALWDQVRERLPGLFYQGGCGKHTARSSHGCRRDRERRLFDGEMPQLPGDSDRAGQQAVIYDNSAAHAGSHGDHNNIGTVFGSALPLLSDDGAVGIIGNAHRKVVMLLQNGFHRGAKPVGDMPCAPGNGSCKGVHLTGGGHTDACKGRGRNAVFLQKGIGIFYHSINDRGLVMVKAHGEKNR